MAKKGWLIVVLGLASLVSHASFAEEVPRSARIGIAFLNPHQCALTPLLFKERDREGRVIHYEWYRCIMPVKFDEGSGTGVIELIHPYREVLQCLSDELRTSSAPSIYIEGYRRENLPKGGYDSYPHEVRERLRGIMRQIMPTTIEFTAVRFFTSDDAADYQEWQKKQVKAGVASDFSAWLKTRNRKDTWRSVPTRAHCWSNLRRR